MKPAGIPAFALVWILSGLFLLASCFSEDDRVAGGWIDTETGQKVSGVIQRGDGSPALGARVRLRPSDYLGPDPLEENAKGVAPSGGSVLDGTCDSAGRFLFDSVETGPYMLEALDKEINAVALAFEMRENRSLALRPTATRPAGSITGRVVFPDGVPSPVVVRIFGLERAILADNSTGVFTFGNLPEGGYTLRFSSPDPYLVPVDQPRLAFKAGSGTNAGEIPMLRSPKPAFRILDGALELPGVDSTNPLILENGAFGNPVDGAYLWAKASLGRADLRGTIASYAKDTGTVFVENNLANCRRMVELARNSGMRSIPDPVAGARRKLVRPASGNLGDIRPDTSDGSLLIVRQARLATAAKPLVLICGSNLTTAAEALLLDPAIGDRLVVFGANNGRINNADSLAFAVVAKKGRLVAWARDYVWDTSWTSTKSPNLFFRNRLGESLRSLFAPVASTPYWAFSSYGDFGAATFLYRRGVWKQGRTGRVPPTFLNQAAPQPADTVDFIDIPRGANDWPAIEDEFYSALTDSAAYHPWPLPGVIQAGAYGAAAEVVVAVEPSTQGEVAAWKSPAAWAEYPVRADTAGNYVVEIRYRADSASQLTLTALPSGRSVIFDLTPATTWSDVTRPITLEAGNQRLRVDGAKGPISIHRILVR